ncbi:hypothetical protein PWT90_05349 [Aphanocladium album]|nr:hypothetical protein PWT90_05349 [Aphanocladium album]
MVGSVFTVSVTTLWGPNRKPDPSQAFGVLSSDGTLVDWPRTLTSVSITSLAPLISISATLITIYDTKGEPAEGLVLGQLYDNGATVTWPGNAAGVITVLPATETTSKSETPSSTPSTSQTPASNPSTSMSVSTPSSGISAGATAGIAIGCTLAGLTIGVLAVVCLFKHRRKRNSSVGDAAIHEDLDNAAMRHELDNTIVHHELDNTTVRHELEACGPEKKDSCHES